MKSNIIKAMLMGALTLSAAPAALAQSNMPAARIGALVYGSQNMTLENSGAVELNIPTYARYDFSVSNAEWIKAEANRYGVKLSVDANPNGTSRKAALTLRTSQGVSTTWNITQPGWDLSDVAQSSVDAGFVVPVRSVDACKNSNGRAQDPLSNSYDGNMNTLYHSNYNGFDPAKPEEWPVLEYYFTAEDAPETESVEIASIVYYPRTSGGENGRFGLVSIEVATMAGGKLTWTALPSGDYDFKMSASPTTVTLPAEMQKGIRGIRFTVKTGDSNGTKGERDYASCAEMKFAKPVVESSDMNKFTDAVCSALKEGTTQADIDAMTDPLLKRLAQMMIDGAYSSKNMVSTHKAIKSPATLAEELQAPGKLYDQTAGITGVVLTPGKYVVIVSGIPASKETVEMRHTYWHGHEIYKDENKNDVKWQLQESAHTLRNGINLIEIKDHNTGHKRVDGDEMGLVYINNFDDAAAAAGQDNPVTVHIVGGLYNGVLSPTLSNAENQAILDKAPYACIDLEGSRVHSVWQVNALKQYSAGQYVRYMNILDQLIIWEHTVLGLEKYNRVPENRTMTYVNYNYYMYQGGRGPTFMYDTQSRVCNPDNLLNSDTDAIWGLSHEWGHQHQMAPYFRWTGMAEVTNNIFSAYNVVHFGYPVATNPGRYPAAKWQYHTEWDRNTRENYKAADGSDSLFIGQIHKIFLNDDYNRAISKPDPESGETKTANSGDNIVMALRSDAAKAAKEGRAFFWNKKLKEFALNQPKYPSKRFASDATYSEESQNVVNPRTALNAIEAYSGNNGELILGPYVNLMYYFDQHPELGCKDLWPDLFESMRQNDFENGSSVEPGKTTVDKYELLVSIFNGNKATNCNVDKTAQFHELFPQSCWSTEGYIDYAGGTLSWTNNSVPAILNCIRKLSRICGYNLYDYFERFGVITVCAIEQGDYGTQHYVMTDDMYDEFKADMDALEKDGTIKPLTEEMRLAISYAMATECPKPTIPNDRPILPTDN